MPQIRPITDLRNTNEISELCHTSKEPIFITKNGYGDLVVMSIEAYEALTESKPAPEPHRHSDEELAALDSLWDSIRNNPPSPKQ